MVKLFSSLLVILLSSYFAHQVQTDFGNVEVSDIRFTGKSGQTISALLYVPKNYQRPLPAVLATQGYINSRETQSGFAIELSRRGFVV